ELDLDRREKQALLDSIRAGIPFPGIEFLAPYFCQELVPLFSYLPAETLIWFDGFDRVEAESERFGQLALERYQRAKEERHLVAPVERIYLNEHEWRAELQQFSQVAGEALTVMAASERAQEATLTVESFLTSDLGLQTALHAKDGSLAPLVERLKAWEKEKIILVAPTQGDAGRLQELLGNHALSFGVVNEPVSEVLGR